MSSYKFIDWTHTHARTQCIAAVLQIYIHSHIHTLDMLQFTYTFVLFLPAFLLLLDEFTR